MRESITIKKKPDLPLASDYDALRALGIEFIRQLGSEDWTDYNIHDPGITLLELLCYGLTDLGYRTSLPIKDLLAQPVTQLPRQDFNRQAFFTARHILTVSPWTESDYRKQLIDLPGVKNAWLVCKKDCACEDFSLYVNCRESRLTYMEPAAGVAHHTLRIKGFYDVLVEFENDRTGDLNSGKLVQTFRFPAAGSVNRLVSATIEVRFPSWQDVQCHAEWNRFRKSNRTLLSVKVTSIARVKGTAENINEDELGRAIRKPVYVDFQIDFAPLAGEVASDARMELKDVPVNLWFRAKEGLRGADARNALKRADLEKVLTDKTSVGLVAQYFRKLVAVELVMQRVLSTLHCHRNLCEDFCHVNAVAIKEVGVCADVDLSNDADIELVLAKAYYLIQQYFSPGVTFHTLQDRMDAGKTVEEIFDGPPLDNGFIDNAELEATGLKAELRISDIMNLLMDIPGVVAIRNLTLISFDNDGRNVGVEAWVLPVPQGHQPRFYAEASQFLLFKNGLPFVPDREELSDTLQVIAGKNDSVKMPLVENDLPVPEGTYYDLQDYYPLRYSLPLTYGVGYEGLPPEAGPERRGQARQLSAFLLFFEQLLANYLEQLAHIGDLFATDARVAKTYFTHLFTANVIRDIDLFQNGLTAEQLQDLAEEKESAGYFDRKNRFLDHLMARFGEQFTDYALMLYSYIGNEARTDAMLVKDKASFLNELPYTSANRGRSFNYQDAAHVCSNDKIAGLQSRIKTVLGIRPLKAYFSIATVYDEPAGMFVSTWVLEDEKGVRYLQQQASFSAATEQDSLQKAEENIESVIQTIHDEGHYRVTGADDRWELHLLDSTNAEAAKAPLPFKKEAAAKKHRDALLAFANTVVASSKIFLVEHILLRPRHLPSAILSPFPPTHFSERDSLLPVCVTNDCVFCGEEDPYSFRMTVVMNGEGGLANAGIAARRFAEQTIRREVPAHIAVKICWVRSVDDAGVDMARFETAWCGFLGELAKKEPDPVPLYEKLVAFLDVFRRLKSVYPPASLHDCADGDEENRVFLNQTNLGKNKKS